ncbi:hypothetical protein, partial [Methylomagnum sp.]
NNRLKAGLQAKSCVSPMSQDFTPCREWEKRAGKACAGRKNTEKSLRFKEGTFAIFIIPAIYFCHAIFVHARDRMLNNKMGVGL